MPLNPDDEVFPDAPADPEDGADDAAKAALVRLPKIDATHTCNARTVTNTYCTLGAGHGTDHVGQGRCKWHGGASIVKSGRYSSIKRDRIRTLIERHAADSDPLNLEPEVAALRALFEDYIERYDAMTAALLAWHEDYGKARVRLPAALCDTLGEAIETWRADILSNVGALSDDEERAHVQARAALLVMRDGPDKSKPRTVLDLADAHVLLDSIGRMVERIEKIKSQNAISRPELNRVMHEMFRSLDTRVRDDVVKQDVINDWMRIAL